MTLCGREAEVQQIVSHCGADRLVVVSSAPGMGLTTLLSKGVLPALQQLGFITLVFSDWQGRQIVNNFKEAIAEAVRSQADDTFFVDVETLDDMLERIAQTTGRYTAVLLDQFEDYLRCHARTDVSDFFDAELSNAIVGRAGRFVLALQDHAIRTLDRFSQYVPNLFGCHLSLGPLAPDAARQMVRAEAERRGLEIEPEAVEALIAAPVAAVAASGGTEGGLHPFLLAQGVSRLFDSEMRLKSVVARKATVDDNGGADRLILESLDDDLGEFNVSHAELLFRWCNILMSPERHRLSVTEKALTEYAGKLNRFVPALRPRLQEMGLLRPVEMPDALRYEIARDPLTPILADWRQRREAVLLARRRAKFRVRSLSVAAGCILAVYLVWLIMTWK